MPKLNVFLVSLFFVSACSTSNPLVGDWESIATGNRTRIQIAADGSLEALLVSRDEDRSIQHAIHDMSADQRDFWSAGAPRQCLLRRSETGTIVYRAFRSVGENAWEIESRNRSTNYSGFAGCTVSDEWVRRRLVLTSRGTLEVRPLAGDDVLLEMGPVDPNATGAAP